MGTILGGGLGCIAAVLAQNVGGGIGNSIIIGTSVFIFGKFLINKPLNCWFNYFKL